MPAIRYPLSAIRYPLSAIRYPLSAIRYPLSLRQVVDLLSERGIDICHETVRFWWTRFGPMFAAEICKRRVDTRSILTVALAS